MNSQKRNNLVILLSIYDVEVHGSNASALRYGTLSRKRVEKINCLFQLFSLVIHVKLIQLFKQKKIKMNASNRLKNMHSQCKIVKMSRYTSLWNHSGNFYGINIYHKHYWYYKSWIKWPDAVDLNISLILSELHFRCLWNRCVETIWIWCKQDLVRHKHCWNLFLNLCWYIGGKSIVLTLITNAYFFHDVDWSSHKNSYQPKLAITITYLTLLTINTGN